VSLYLHGRVGPYRLLLPAERVLEVWPARAEADPGQWRRRTLPVVDLRAVMGVLPEPDGAHVAYGATPEDGEAAVLTLDAIMGLITLGPEALARLPAVSARTAEIFDAVTRAPVGAQHLLRLKQRPTFAGAA
jgi:hypothetical protein